MDNNFKSKLDDALNSQDTAPPDEAHGEIVDVRNSDSNEVLEKINDLGADNISTIRIEKTKLDKQAFNAILQCKNLQELYLYDVKLPEGVINKIGVLQQLNKLTIMNPSSGYSSDVTGATLYVINKMPNLKLLAIPGAMIDTNDLDAITHIETLDISHNKYIYDHGISILLQGNTLKYLNASYTKLTSKCLKMLRFIKTLKEVDLRHTALYLNHKLNKFKDYRPDVKLHIDNMW